jgi:hypothetical protein
MYIVRNLTNKPIVLSDIRAEVGPYRIVDLEQISTRGNIDRSSDLKAAISMKRLQFVKQTVIRVPEKISTPSPPPEVHKPALDENKLKEIVRSVLQEQLQTSGKPIEETVSKAISTSMSSVMDALRDKLNAVNVGAPAPVETHIDPSKLAEIQQKAVEKISRDISSDNIKQGKKIKLSDPNISDLAKEL